MLRSPLGDLRFEAQRLRLRAARAGAPLHPGHGRDAVLAVDRAARAGCTCPGSGATTSASCGWTRPTATATSGGRSSPGPMDEGIRELVVKRGGRVPRLPLPALAARRGRLGRHGVPVGVPDPELPAARGPGAPAADVARHVRGARGADLLASCRGWSTSTPRRFRARTRTARWTVTSSSSTAAATSPSRKGVGPGSISPPPDGRAARAAPGRVRGQHRRTRSTDELAVMLDTTLPLHPTAAALTVEDAELPEQLHPVARAPGPSSRRAGCTRP